MRRPLTSDAIWKKIKFNALQVRQSRSGSQECVLFLHLAYNLSRRRINWLLGSTSHLNGNNAQRIIKHYLAKDYGGHLFGHPVTVCCETIAELMECRRKNEAQGTCALDAAVKTVLGNVPQPRILQVTSDTSLILPINTGFRSESYGAQMTNLVNRWFKELRSRFESHCHYYDTARSKLCGARPLETAHFTFDRASLIDRLASVHRTACDSHGVVSGGQAATHYRYNLAYLYRDFLDAHRLRPGRVGGRAGREDAVVFFCKEHHIEYDKLVRDAAKSLTAYKQLEDWRRLRIKPYL